MDSEATSPLSPGWTSVRFSPGEDTVGKDVLAVCVLVDCEDSSTDRESDYDDNEGPSTKPFGERPQQPESLPLPKPLFRHSSLREPLARAASPQGRGEPHALQRADSFQAPSKPQNWRKSPSNLTPANKRSLSPSKEPSPLPPSSWSSPPTSPPSSSPSASAPGHPPDSFSPPQVTAYKPHPQVSGSHYSPSTPIFLRRAKSQGAPKEMPLYVPHCEVLERAEYCLVSPGGESLKSPMEMAPGGCQEAGGDPEGTRSTHRDPHLTVRKDRSLPDQKQSLTAVEDPREGNIGATREEQGGSELAKKSPSLKKLLLTPEQKSMLLDWSDSFLENAPLQLEERLSQDRARNGRAGSVLRPVHPLSLPQRREEPPAAQTEAPKSMRTPAVQAPRGPSEPPPKSPLRFITNAFRKSVEQFFHSSDSGKKAWAKPESQTLPTGQPHTFTSSLNLQKRGSNKEGNPQSPRKHSASRAATFSLGSSAPRAAQSSDPSVPNSAHSLPRQSSAPLSTFTSPPCSKAEDFPTLLQKVSLQEPLPDPRSPKKKTSLFSTFRPKDKSFESFLQESKQRKDIRELFSSPKGRTLPGDRVPSPGKLMQPFRSASLTWVGRPRPPAGSKHDQVGVQVKEATSSLSSTTSSSADEESDPQLSPGPQDKKTLRRRRKLEKATRQLAKQEELKRLHKAQAIQRQLEEVEERQRASEIQGVRLEKALRGEADSGTQDEAQLLQEWFTLVLEKNKLMRYESELLIMAQELELEDHQSRLEQKLREKMLKEESQKDENDRNEEQEIFTEMMQVIKQRDKLVDSLEEQRIKEKAEDQHFESFVLSRGCQLSRT